ncbi:MULTISPECIES: phosphatase PAP2 family protein [unclassified Microbacterium]|uniref:acid phosphatase n=1 Tax=unclassified Microbacterium TaxID=2609290 RepID=UPI0012F84881|nr:phosphatase PAP2 family protein [Microbacterium sp. MAH-37]
MPHSPMRLFGAVRPASLAALVIAGSIALTGGAQWSHPAAKPSPAPSATSAPFTQAQLDRVYESDRTVDYVPLLSGFTTLQTSYPEVLDENLTKTLQINHDATPEESAAAIVDEYGDMSYTMGNALGAKLGAIYQEAWEEGRLPKTVALIHKDGGRAQSESTTPSKNYFDYDRPYVVAPDQVVYRDKEGGDAYSSTSGSYPSGHTNQAYWQGTLLATLLPELSPQILARTSESGNYRVVMAMHYPLDIIGGRMMGQASIAKRWADPEFRSLLEQASAELHAVLEADCGAALKVCIAQDTSYMKTKDADELYRDRLTYGFERIGAAGVPMDVPRVAAALLISSHPELTESQRIDVLEQTAIGSGYPLDLSVASTSSWQRIDLAAAMSAHVTVDGKGTVHVAGFGS